MMKTILQQMIESLHDKQVQYVHFKSNLQLARSFRGETDFDLLVRRRDSPVLQNTLLQFGAKPRYGTFNTVYPSVEHWLLYDCDREELFHFHVHYELLFGCGNKKNYCFPDLDAVFAEAVQHPDFDIQTVSARFELFLLVMRIILKYDPFKSLPRRILWGSRPPAGMCAELEDLLNRIDRESFNQWLFAMYPGQAEVIVQFLADYRSGSVKEYFTMIQSARQLKACLGAYKRTDERTAVAFSKLRRISKKHQVRWLPAGGMVIGLVGADGAGKTTLVKDITIWLNQKLSSQYLYLGKPKAKKTLFFMKHITQMWLRIRYPNADERQAFKCLTVARERNMIWLTAKFLAGNGWLAVTDRYPLREFRSMRFPMDGPRLPPSNSFCWQELEIYDSIDSYPDLLIVLDIDYTTAIARKGTHSDAEISRQHEEKIVAIKRIKESADPDVVIIDANVDYSIVRRNVKKAIWDRL